MKIFRHKRSLEAVSVEEQDLNNNNAAREHYVSQTR